MTIHGTIEYRMSDSGSKSEGFRAYLICEDGEVYNLYRAGHLPYGDPFFQPLDGTEADVSGTYEEQTGYFLVESVTLEDGETIESAETTES